MKVLDGFPDRPSWPQYHPPPPKIQLSSENLGADRQIHQRANFEDEEDHLPPADDYDCGEPVKEVNGREW